jgi:hypothetical protein
MEMELDRISKLFEIADHMYENAYRCFPNCKKVYFSFSEIPLPFLTMYVAPSEDDDVVHVDYMRCLKFRLERKAWDRERPHFLSEEMEDLLRRTYLLLAFYNGQSSRSNVKRKFPPPFGYAGPFLAKDYLSSYVQRAAQKAGLPYEAWKRFWRRHSKNIKKDMEPWVDVSSIGNCHW